ncbi:hypothetical protein ACQEV4_27930 [Streptomyces shenzhenensis]|uniref:hypothetical protein n=1 Tax=Streptomyces shenzhenensis TaxID=943815 RepID=UPI003D91538E
MGDTMSVLRWAAADPGVPMVLALHGITANGLSRGPVAGRLAGRTTARCSPASRARPSSG